MAFDASSVPTHLGPFEPVHDSCVYLSRDQRFVPLKLWQARRAEFAEQPRRAADRVTSAAYAEVLVRRGLRAFGALRFG